MDVKSINPNPTSFKALLNLIGDKSCLPKGATKRLQKLVQPIGTNTDIITIGVYKRGTNETRVYIGTPPKRSRKSLFIPFVEKIIQGKIYPNAISKYFNSKEIRMNNYKEIYRYMLDLKDKFKSTV